MFKLTSLLFGLFLVFEANATNHRTFVAASGTDSGTCGPTTPCRSLEYALGQTNSGGEIVITQSGGYGNASGGLVINKSVSIIAEHGVFAALAPTSGTGITIATAGIDVAIKGLTINGRGGDEGISMTNGASLDLDNVTIANISEGTGLRALAPVRLMVKNSTFRNMSYGIAVGYGANLLLDGTRLTDIHTTGIVLSGGDSGTTLVTATDTLVQCNAYASRGIENWASTGNIGKIYLNQVTVTNCDVAVDAGPQSSNVIAISNSFVTGSGWYGFNAQFANFFSAGNNHLSGNATDTVGTITTGTILH
jgi:hypothetical protein